MNIAFVGARIHDGKTLHDDHAILVSNSVPTLIRRADIPSECRIIPLDGGVVLPGFVDLQVNGGGGVMVDGTTSVATLRTIAKAHAGLGVAGLLPTLITDTPLATAAVIDAVAVALREEVSGILGLHLEGPHLDPRRKGAHDAALIRPMDADDLRQLLDANERLPNLKVTVAPEAVTCEQITTLKDAGVLVSLGHSDCDYETAMRSFDAGATCATHLFNAMSPLTSRTPGMVGAILDAPVSAGVIADGIHVHPATLRTALAAKRGPGELFLVSDAMACAGTSQRSFTLGGREIRRHEGRLNLADGTLAGADLSLSRAVQVMADQVGDSLETAIARATSIPAAMLRSPMGLGKWPDRLTELRYMAELGADPVGMETLL
ncbi:N-acetylglucosamine 6-phosphate deacetylase [Sulfitobacter brevis]|uniref:N-acetylglucosamine 6-phosphate deacetylase n=1 Tax=Sulfitobacter brevis TaxID=74348 RepID=A0A1I1X2U2_9RHOB|nr:N-acetylglucosamine-6-phosphate deacetylase [Sulfitobacter brevis]SFE01764.1 N-acetylglucosamine 6-phosphate deacetylase [Sulfitobacter brevis]